MRAARRALTFKVLSVVLSLVLVVGLLEVVLRLLPVSDGLRGLPVNEDDPVYRFAAHRTLRWSKGWRCSLANEIRTNNYGFVNDTDYDPTSTAPLLAIIGDSFVEAAMVPYRETAAGILQRAVAGIGRVYSFGSSGSALSQYLAYARYARDEFQPDGMVFIIVGNDFDESLLKYRSHPGFHYFVEREDGRLLLKRLDRSIPWWKDALVSLTVGRYIVMNLEAGNVVDYSKQWVSTLFGERRRFAGNVDAAADPERVRDSERAIDEFLARLPEMSHLPPRRILLVLDPLRPEIYRPQELEAARSTYVALMRQYLIRAAAAAGFEVIDLEKAFVHDYQRRGIRFEYSNDYHWNAIGHEVVAQSSGRSSVFHAVFGGPADRID